MKDFQRSYHGQYLFTTGVFHTLGIANFSYFSVLNLQNQKFCIPHILEKLPIQRDVSGHMNWPNLIQHQWHDLM